LIDGLVDLVHGLGQSQLWDVVDLQSVHGLARVDFIVYLFMQTTFWVVDHRTEQTGFLTLCLVTEWTLLFALGECRVLPWPWDRVHSVRDRVHSVPHIVHFVLSLVDRAYSILAVVLLGTVLSLSLALGQSPLCP
jgi:hypothetical protein